MMIKMLKTVQVIFAWHGWRPPDRSCKWPEEDNRVRRVALTGGDDQHEDFQDKDNLREDDQQEDDQHV